MVLMALFFSCLVSIFFLEDDLKKKIHDEVTTFVFLPLSDLFFSLSLSFYFW